MAALRPKQIDKTDEASLVARAVRKDQTAIRAIIKQNKRRLFRLARSVLRDDGDAEDAVQEAYLRAFPALADFREESSLTTWLSKIVLNELLQRLRSNAALYQVQPFQRPWPMRRSFLFHYRPTTHWTQSGSWLKENCFKSWNMRSISCQMTSGWFWWREPLKA